MNRGFGGKGGPGGGKVPGGGGRAFDKFRRDGKFDRDQAVPDQRFGGPGKPGFPKPKDDSAPPPSRGRGNERFAPRDTSGRFAPRDGAAPRDAAAPRRDEAPREDRPFFPKSSAPRAGGNSFPGQRSPTPRDGGDFPAPRSGDRGFAPRGADRGFAPRDGFDNRAPRPYSRDDSRDSRPPRRDGDDRPRGSFAPRDQAPAPRPFRPAPPPVVRDDRPVRVPKVTDSVEEVDASEYVCGIHAVEALLENSSRRVQRVLLLRGNNDERLHRIQAKAEELRIPCQQIDSRYIEQKVPGKKHQGVAAICNAREYADWGVLQSALRQKVQKGLAPVVLVASAIEDPRNLGAIARTCVGLDVDALILPMKGGCGLTALADETSAGALSQLPVARPKDLEKTLRDLSEDGFTIVGLDAEGDDIRTIDFTGPVVLVAGGEDRGIPPHMRRPCDRVASIPMSSKLQSYNASVAAGLALWEIRRSR